MNLRTWWYVLVDYLQPEIQYEVITSISDVDGNCSDEWLVHRPTVTGFGPEGDITERVLWISTLEDVSQHAELFRARLPVFSLGEVVIVYPSGREITGHQRNPSKWHVESERFWSLRRALRRAKQILKEER